MAKTPVTIRDIAEYCGVSVATVSRVINQNGHCSEETRQKIQHAIDSLGYVGNTAAKMLREKKTNIVGVLVNDLVNTTVSEMVLRLQHYLRMHGYISFLCTIVDLSQTDSYIRMLRAMNVCGVVLISSDITITLPQDWQIAKIYLYREPDIAVENSDCCILKTDYHEAARLALQELDHLGCQKLAVLDGSGRRKKAAEQAMQSMGRRVDTLSYLRCATVSFADALAAIDQSLANGPAADGYYCTSDLLALGAIRSLEAHGLRVPEDVKVIGCHDMEIAMYNHRPLTTIRHDMDGMCLAAIHVLDAYRSQPETPPEPVRRTFGVSLIRRETT